MIHTLKIWPQYFACVKDGSKTFEVRKNDRAYQKGDEIWLKEWKPDDTLVGGGTETGEVIGPFVIGYVLPIDAERVVFSIIPLIGTVS